MQYTDLKNDLYLACTMDSYNTKNTEYAIENVEQRLLDLTQSGYPNGKIKTTWKILNSSDIRYMHIKTTV